MSHSGLEVQQTIIGASYIIFAIQMYLYIRGKKLNWKVARPIFYIIGVFLFCAFAGYIGEIFKIPFVGMKWIHNLLCVFAVLLVFSNQAKVIGKLMVD